MDARTGRRGPALGRRTFLALLGASALSACGDDSAEAEDKGVEEVFGFATSAIREAPNGAEVLEAVRDRTGVELRVLSGEMESRSPRSRRTTTLVSSRYRVMSSRRSRPGAR